MAVFSMLPSEEVAATLAARAKSRRLALNLTQEGLARRSGVALGTLKQFERTGRIALKSFIRLAVALEEEATLENLFLHDDPVQQGRFPGPKQSTLDDFLKAGKKPKRGRIK